MERIPLQLLKYEILLKIPATTVVPFMFTCKTYYALLSSDRSFAEAHRQTGKLRDCKAIVVVFNRALSVDYNLQVTKDLNLPQTEVDATRKDVKVIGSCRDLVCMLERSKNFILWNPTTGAFRKIPITLSPSSHGTRFFYGLGYDPLRCDHKLVVICNHLIDRCG
ncbi:hypothetical protein MLD38_029636 [Melastoma candidum]|uniref:Uncharacterized protein n=1 Tax=Melastoma candidum TaxID=119954 RepID=A0ACB9N6R3_9MYRT|nr:hypothetical protein MLD38_029636 [Melastoma candidum]